LRVKRNHRRAAAMTGSARNRLWLLLTSALDISETAETTDSAALMELHVLLLAAVAGAFSHASDLENVRCRCCGCHGNTQCLQNLQHSGEISHCKCHDVTTVGIL